jgi:6-phosphogluconolactonase
VISQRRVDLGEFVEAPGQELTVLCNSDWPLGVAKRFVEQSQIAIKQRGRFVVALTGGHSAWLAYSTLATREFADRIDWDRVYLFWGDERCVGLDHPRSNHRLIRQVLLDAVPIPLPNVFPIEGANVPGAAAELYRSLVDSGASPAPFFDLVHLGLGDDGHVASIFPHCRATIFSRRSVEVAIQPTSSERRVTLTPCKLRNTRRIQLLVTGAAKATLVKRALEGPFDPVRYPVQWVVRSPASVEWMLREDAASALHSVRA